MKWIFRTDAARQELSDSPERLLKNVVPIKDNGIRRVYYVGGYYIKQECCNKGHFLSEWNSALLLASKGVDCVEYLALGRGNGGEMLVSREQTDSLPVGDYLLKQGLLSQNAMDVYRLLARYAAHFYDSGLYHPDLHWWNILYAPETRRLVLVDVKGVRRWHFWDWFHGWQRFFILDLVPRTMAWEAYLELFKLAGARKPENVAVRIIEKGQHRWIHGWPKRRSQILTGYSKFSFFQDDWLIKNGFSLSVAMEQGEWLYFDTREEAEKHFLYDFYLHGLGLPCRQAMAWNQRENILLMEKSEPSLNKDMALSHSRIKVEDYENWDG